MNMTHTTGSPLASSLADIHAAVKQLSAMPKGEWMLVSPQGQMWAHADPKELLRVLALQVYGGWAVADIALKDGGA